jgi:hypothetical protein
MMVPTGFLKSFYMIFIGMFLLMYCATTLVAIYSWTVGDLAPVLTGCALATLSVLLVAIALDELRRLVIKE